MLTIYHWGYHKQWDTKVIIYNKILRISYTISHLGYHIQYDTKNIHITVRHI